MNWKYCWKAVVKNFKHYFFQCLTYIHLLVAREQISKRLLFQILWFETTCFIVTLLKGKKGMHILLSYNDKVYVNVTWKEKTRNFQIKTSHWIVLKQISKIIRLLIRGKNVKPKHVRVTEIFKETPSWWTELLDCILTRLCWIAQKR